MNEQKARQIYEGLNSPFWQWLKDDLKARADKACDLTMNHPVASLEDQTNREHFIGAYRILTDLITDIPQSVKQQLKEAQNE